MDNPSKKWNRVAVIMGLFLGMCGNVATATPITTLSAQGEFLFSNPGNLTSPTLNQLEAQLLNQSFDVRFSYDKTATPVEVPPGTGGSSEFVFSTSLEMGMTSGPIAAQLNLLPHGPYLQTNMFDNFVIFAFGDPASGPVSGANVFVSAVRLVAPLAASYDPSLGRTPGANDLTQDPFSTFPNRGSFSIFFTDSGSMEQLEMSGWVTNYASVPEPNMLNLFSVCLLGLVFMSVRRRAARKGEFWTLRNSWHMWKHA